MPWESARKSPAYNTAEYKRKRLACLKAARWRCQIRVPGICIGAASEADHATQLANDPGHEQLRAACKPCHRYVTAQQGNDARRRGPADPKPQPRAWWNEAEDKDRPPF